MTGLRELVEAVAVNRAARGCGGCEACQACADVRWSQYRLANAITPDVLAAVEAIVALGKWRATEPQCEPDYAIRDRLDAIADRLAAREGE